MIKRFDSRHFKMKKLTVTYFRDHFFEVMKDLEEENSTICLTRNNQPVAYLSNQPPASPRQFIRSFSGIWRQPT